MRKTTIRILYGSSVLCPLSSVPCPLSRSRGILLFLAFACLLGRPALATAAEKTRLDPPRLAVLVFFDQLRGDYLARWEGLFEEGGFRRLQQNGAWFQRCHYPYAYTVTGAGHASVAAGCSPDKHGIVGNDWYERGAGTAVNCVSSERYERVPLVVRGQERGASKKKGALAPDRLLAPTLADALKLATRGEGKVVALSWKDRAAILPGGQAPNACYWMDAATGTFVTSTYYRPRLHPWVEDYNRARPADQWQGKEWTRLRPALDYARFSGPDDVAGEGQGFMQGRTFPHPFGGGLSRLRPLYYGALFNSPFGNEVLLGLAKRAIEGERLGTRNVPDLLCLSFSSNDAIGHCWGPDSQEVLDVTLRSDLLVRELLTFLDDKVGKGRYVLALTADHGICPLPEVSRRAGREAARIPSSLLGSQAEKLLDEEFGGSKDHARWVEATSGPWVYLNRKLIEESKLKPADVEDALATWLKKQKGVQTAYTRHALLRGVPTADRIGQSVRRSFYSDRSGDIFVVLKPYHLLSSPLSTGTTHGTPHAYDTHVPLLVYGPGIVKGVRKDEVTPQSAAAILSRALRIKAPAHADAAVPERLFK